MSLSLLGCSLDFRLLANITATDRVYQEQERLLTEIENSRQVTPEWHFKKKLASVLERHKAYCLLLARKLSKYMRIAL